MGFGAGSSSSQSSGSISNVKNYRSFKADYNILDVVNVWYDHNRATTVANGTDMSTGTTRTPANGNSLVIKRIIASAMNESTNQHGSLRAIITWPNNTTYREFSGLSPVILDFGAGLKLPAGNGAQGGWITIRQQTGGNAQVNVFAEIWEVEP